MKKILEYLRKLIIPLAKLVGKNTYQSHIVVGTILLIIFVVIYKNILHLDNSWGWLFAVTISTSCCAGLIEFLSPRLKIGHNTLGGLLRTMIPTIIFLILEINDLIFN